MGSRTVLVLADGFISSESRGQCEIHHRHGLMRKGEEMEEEQENRMEKRRRSGRGGGNIQTVWPCRI